MPAPYFADRKPNGRLVYNYTGALHWRSHTSSDKLFLCGDFLRVSPTTKRLSYHQPTYRTYNAVGTTIGEPRCSYSGQVYDPFQRSKRSRHARAGNNLCHELRGTGRNAVQLATSFRSEQSRHQPRRTYGSFRTLMRWPVIQKQNLNSTRKYIAGTTTNNFSTNLPFHKGRIQLRSSSPDYSNLVRRTI